MSSCENKRVYALFENWMTSELKLEGLDLLVFSYIHSITKDGSKPFIASAEIISKKWFGTDKKARAIKDSLSSLVVRGIIDKTQTTVSGRVRNSYISCGQKVLDGLRQGVELKPAPLKRRNKSKDGVLHHPGSGTVPPLTKAVPYHYEGGTVPPSENGTVPPSENGTVPPNKYINDIYKKYCLQKGVEIDSEEEEQNFYIIFFFRNAKDPKLETKSFISYNVKKEWSHGDLNTHDKRVCCAENDWNIKNAYRIDKYLLNFLLALYVWAKNNSVDGSDCLLDADIKGKRLDSNTYHLYCSPKLQELLEHSIPGDILKQTMREKLKVNSLFYIKI